MKDVPFFGRMAVYIFMWPFFVTPACWTKSATLSFLLIVLTLTAAMITLPLSLPLWALHFLLEPVKAKKEKDEPVE